MADYIDSDRLWQNIENIMDVLRVKKRERERFKFRFGFILDNEPSVDVVEVVRCKDCKHRIMNYAENAIAPWITCRTIGFRDEIEVDGDFYCAWGEKV
jgi:hypothetical protein